jgi:hypothetical protein
MRQVKGLDPRAFGFLRNLIQILGNPLLQPWVGQFDRGVVVRVFDMGAASIRGGDRWAAIVLVSP